MGHLSFGSAETVAMAIAKLERDVAHALDDAIFGELRELARYPLPGGAELTAA